MFCIIRLPQLPMQPLLPIHGIIESNWVYTPLQSVLKGWFCSTAMPWDPTSKKHFPQSLLHFPSFCSLRAESRTTANSYTYFRHTGVRYQQRKLLSGIPKVYPLQAIGYKSKIIITGLFIGKELNVYRFLAGQESTLFCANMKLMTV